MRKKVALIKGQSGLAKKITSAVFERINADHVMVTVMLKRPQYHPDGAGFELNYVMSNIPELARYWAGEEQPKHFFASEYANFLLDQGADDIRAVEGHCLYSPWVYEVVRTLHRQMNHVIIDCEPVPVSRTEWKIDIDGVLYNTEDAVERLMPFQDLG